MRFSLKKGLAGVATLAAVGLVAPIVAPGLASAATNSGAPSPTPTGIPTPNNSNTPFSIGLPSGAACPGDSNGSLSGRSYKVQTFILPTSVDLPTTLAFQASGAPLSGTARGSLANTAGSFQRNLLTDTAVAPAVTGNISGLPTFSLGVYPANFFPNGTYNVGVACNYDADTTTGSVNYWAKTVTITNTGSAANGPGQFTWAFGAVPAAPTIGTVTPGDQTLSVAFTAPVADPVVSTYTLTATPQGGGATVTQTGATSPINLTGLVNGTTYNLSLTATNSVGTSAAGTGVGTPAPAPRPGVTGFTATPGTGKVDLTWVTPTGVAPTGYSLVITPQGGTASTVTLPAGTTSYSATGLAAGTPVSFQLTPLHPAPYTAPSSTISSTPLAAQVLIQDISVTRPVGALVLTQVCGAYGSLPAEATPSLGFPAGLPAAAAVNSSTVAAPTAGGTAPTTGAAPGGPVDAVRNQYPYPVNPDGTSNATYPTHCGINLGNAQFVRSGAGAGQFFSADGRLNQVTVVDTRDGDLGWNVVGQVSNFTAGAGKSFSGSQLGWTPVKTEDTSAFTDSLGNTYDQVAAAGGVIAPNTAVASGLSSNRTLISAAPFATVSAASSTGGLGTAIADARLKLLIPITAQSGTYTATLTISTL